MMLEQNVIEVIRKLPTDQLNRLIDDAGLWPYGASPAEIVILAYQCGDIEVGNILNSYQKLAA